MGHGVVHIDLPEAREPLPDLLIRKDADAERRLAFDILVECDLGTRQQADRHVRLPDRREAASNRIAEFQAAQAVWGGLGPMTVLTMRFKRGHFTVSGPDIELRKFKARREAD